MAEEVKTPVPPTPPDGEKKPTAEKTHCRRSSGTFETSRASGAGRCDEARRASETHCASKTCRTRDSCGSNSR